MKSSCLKQWVPCIVFWIKKIAWKSSFIFLNTSVWSNSLILKNIARSSMKLKSQGQIWDILQGLNSMGV